MPGKVIAFKHAVGQNKTFHTPSNGRNFAFLIFTFPAYSTFFPLLHNPLPAPSSPTGLYFFLPRLSLAFCTFPNVHVNCRSGLSVCSNWTLPAPSSTGQGRAHLFRGGGGGLRGEKGVGGGGRAGGGGGRGAGGAVQSGQSV